LQPVEDWNAGAALIVEREGLGQSINQDGWCAIIGRALKCH
jgi:hypothetical protein